MAWRQIVADKKLYRIRCICSSRWVDYNFFTQPLIKTKVLTGTADAGPVSAGEWGVRQWLCQAKASALLSDLLHVWTDLVVTSLTLSVSPARAGESSSLFLTSSFARKTAGVDCARHSQQSSNRGGWCARGLGRAGGWGVWDGRCIRRLIR